MQYLTDILDYVLYTEEEHYLESVECKDESCLDIEWIKENINKVNHIYMYARLLKDSIENE
jgi:hypothetical protein